MVQGSAWSAVICLVACGLWPVATVTSYCAKTLCFLNSEQEDRQIFRRVQLLFNNLRTSC